MGRRALPPVDSSVISKDGSDPTPQGQDILPEIVTQERALVVLALRLEGHSYDDIEKLTKLSKDQIRYALRKARAGGKLRDVLDLVTHEAVPQAVENLIAILRDPANANHWDATEKTLAGTGVFQRYGHMKGGVAPGAQVPPLQVNFISANGGPMPTVIVNSERGAVIGTPREDAIDAAQ